MASFLTSDGVNYFDYYNQIYADNNTVAAVVATGGDSVGLIPDWAIAFADPSAFAGGDVTATTGLAAASAAANANGTTGPAVPLIHSFYDQTSAADPAGYVPWSNPIADTAAQQPAPASTTAAWNIASSSPIAYSAGTALITQPNGLSGAVAAPTGAAPATMPAGDPATVSGGLAGGGGGTNFATLPFKGFNYTADVNGSYEFKDSLATPATGLVSTGANAAAMVLFYGIDAVNSTVVTDANYTDINGLASTVAEAVGDGLSVMVRPTIQILDPTLSAGQDTTWRTGYNPGLAGSAAANTFFASYQSMIVSQAKIAQANGAQDFCIGVELDQLTGPSYKSYWDSIIAAVKAPVSSGGAGFTGKLTYSALWSADTSPWAGDNGLPAGTGNLATQISFWNELDYIGIDEYAPISDVVVDPAQDNNPTAAQLVPGWTQTPTDPTTLAVTSANGGGNQSLISYFEGVAATIGKPLLFTELGYESATDAASIPFGSSTNVFDPQLQANLYQAFFTAWQEDGNSSLAGVYFWNWEPDATGPAAGPASGANFSPQGEPAQAVITSNFTPAVASPVVVVAETNVAGVAGFMGSPTAARGTAGIGGTGALAGDSDTNSSPLTISAVTGGTIGSFFDTEYGEIQLNANGSYTYFVATTNATATALANAPTGAPALDTISFTVMDGNGATANSTLAISDYRDPTAVSETGSTSAGGTASGTAGTAGTGALAGNSDPDGVSLTAALNNPLLLANPNIGKYGTLTLNADGSYSYAANSPVVLASAFAADGGKPLQDGFSVLAIGGVNTFAVASLTITVDQSQVPGDFTGTGTSNVLFNDSTTGDTGYWTTDGGGNVTGFHDFGAGNSAYAIAGVGDFDGGGKAEVLWNDSSNGDTGYWTTDANGNVTGFHDFAAGSTAYAIAGVGDFDGSGRDEVLWHNSSNGDTGYWTTDSNGTVTGFHDFGSGDTSYAVAGVGDFDGNGKAEVLFSDSATGDTGYWTTDSNGTVTGFHDFGAGNTAYAVAGTGDFDGSGRDEVLWHNSSNGDTGYWTTDANGTVTGFHDFGSGDTSYAVAGVGDFDNSGRSEVLWHNSSTGDTGYWTTDSNGNVTGFHDFGSGNTAYAVADPQGGTTAAAAQGSLATGGGSGSTVLAVPNGDASLTALASPEIFDFSSLGFGNDTIAGFDPTQDAIQLNHTLINSFAGVQTDMSAIAAGTLIALDSTRSIILAGVAPASLTAASFRFV